LSDYKQWLERNAGNHGEIQKLKGEVVEFSKKFEVPQ